MPRVQIETTDNTKLNPYGYDVQYLCPDCYEQVNTALADDEQEGQFVEIEDDIFLERHSLYYECEICHKVDKD